MDPTLSTTANGAHFLAQEPRNPSYVARNMNYAAQTWLWTINQLGKRNIDMS